MALVLGISASLRNARFGIGNHMLVDELGRLESEEALQSYLERQTKIRTDNFVEAGRAKNRPFDEIYNELQKMKGDRGLSNSEAALAAGLWGALQEGAQIDHIGLTPFFPPFRESRNVNELKTILLKADAILLSGPVYFGDRGSLANEFIEFIANDPDLRAHVRDKVYAGIAVGAKRNGGQETTLIYQIIDMTNLNMLAVGNDSKTTSQYGGIAVAGDVGSLPSDTYGIKTCIGTGRRVARTAKMLQAGHNHTLQGKLNIDVWLLQDSADHHGRTLFEGLLQEAACSHPSVNLRLRDFTQETVMRCIACDICPTHVGDPDEYRCIITSDKDLFKRDHQVLIDTDAFLLAAYSPIDRRNVNSVYQRFVERTRYWRRDDYVIGDRLAAPFVISQINANQNLHIRMLTSEIRHHTVLHHPVIGYEYENKLLNREALLKQMDSFIRNAITLTVGRLRLGHGTEDFL